ncbi:MAG TPA: hypothetical protein ENN75_02720, partial [candidate division Zixibacteria bacterium]|nr:hypothetical protein [candidate division Zixibacteria bacterium]
MLWKRSIILCLLLAGFALAEGFALYIHGSPSMTLSNDWFNYVNQFPSPEAGFSIEIPTNTVFTIRAEGTYVMLPAGGVLEEGFAIYGTIGGIIKNNLTSATQINIGPQLIIGQVTAKGRYRSTNYGEEEDYSIDFDGSGMGVGLGIIAGLRFAVTEHLRIGANLSANYFGVANDEVPIVGFNYDDPSEGQTSGTYRYNGEYTALSLRLVL